MMTFKRTLLSVVVPLILACEVYAQPGPGEGGGGARLDSWSFNDTNWLSNLGYWPRNFYNISNGPGGNGNMLVLDSTNSALLLYDVTIPDYYHTNLTVDQGSVSFWFRPSWSSADRGGSGPGDAGRLIEVGYYTTNASIGWWSLFLDPGGTNIYFSAQDDAGHGTNYFAAPVSLTSNVWTFITLLYSSNSTALYTNGVQVSAGDPVSVLPPVTALGYGFAIGSDVNGNNQAHGAFDDLATYNYPLDSLSISGTYNVFGIAYFGPSFSLFSGSASSYPTNTPFFNVIGGPGFVQRITNSASCTTSNQPKFANFTATVQTNGTMTVAFDIVDGKVGTLYDVFACAPLQPGGNSQWYWMGQGQNCNRYRITNQPNAFSFYIMAESHDSDGDGLTDAFELLVSKTDPSKPDTDMDGIPDGWAVLHNISPTGNASQDPDVDALTNLQEYRYGTDPLKNEGFAIWVGNLGTFGI